MLAWVNRVMTNNDKGHARLPESIYSEAIWDKLDAKKEIPNEDQHSEVGTQELG